MEEEAAAATRRAEAARFDAVRSLNEAELSKRSELGERLCGVYYAMRAYGQQSQLSLSRLEPIVRALQLAAADASHLEKSRQVVWRQLASAMHSELGRAFTTSGQARAGVTEKARMPGTASKTGGAGGAKAGESGSSAAGGGGRAAKAQPKRMTGGIGVGDGAGLDESGKDLAAGPLDLIDEVVDSVAQRVREQLEEMDEAKGEEDFTATDADTADISSPLFGAADAEAEAGGSAVA